MKKNKSIIQKQKVEVLLTMFMILGMVSIVCCTEEAEFLPTNDNLSINSQIPMTRSGGEQIFGHDPRTLSHVEEDECGLYALVEVKKNDRNALTGEKGQPTADEYYDRLKDYAKSIKDENNNQVYSGGAMTNDILLKVGQRFNLIGNNVSLELLSNEQKNSFFKNNGKDVKIVLIMKRDQITGELRPHYAKVDSYSKKSQTITYRDSDGLNQKIEAKDILGAFY